MTPRGRGLRLPPPLASGSVSIFQLDSQWALLLGAVLPPRAGALHRRGSDRITRGTNLYRYVLDNALSFTDPRGLDVTITLYPGASGLGHIGVNVNSSQTFGLYPLEDSISMLVGEDVPGTIKPDRRRSIQTIVIPATPEQDAAMQRVIEAGLGSRSPKYNLFFRNCAVFVEDVLRAGGLQVPNTNLPRELMRDLQRLYGGARGAPAALSELPMLLP